MASQINLYDDVGASQSFTGEDVKNLGGGTSAKAWVNFNGTGTPAIRDSLNVDSITDVGSGSWGVNFTSGTFSDINFVWTGTAGRTTDGGNAIVFEDFQYRTTTYIRYRAKQDDVATSVDRELLMLVAHA